MSRAAVRPAQLPTSTRVLVVEDGAAARQLILSILENSGYSTHAVSDGESALRLANQEPPDAVVLDLTLPGLSGLQVCTALRRWFGGPILVVSGNGEETTIVEALDRGADDYLTKPFGASELLARMRAIMRRPAERPSPRQALAVGDLSFDFARHRVSRGDHEIRLTKTEFKIVSVLAQQLDRVVPTHVLLRYVWGPHHGDYAQTLRVHVGHIRSKIEKDPSKPRYLLTQAGVGYRLQASEPTT